MMQFLKTRWQLLLIGLLSMALIATLVFFGALGRVADKPSSDGRLRLLLTPAERDLVLNEMRHLLATVQGIIVAAQENDMKRVAETARAVGMADVRAMPPEIRGPLIGKLPIEFKRLGFGVHEDLDMLALDAEALRDRDHTLKQLAQLMQKCVACHATYAIAAEGGKNSGE
ncbi:MAG: hypothetical protein PHD37_18270 [Gallionellaceae bacterium]|nr:hypothetical protein [Gallionellaceae bacterium]